MNILASYGWLKEHVGTALPPEEFARRLSEAGMGVERIHRHDALLDKVVVATVVKLSKHPNADKLTLAVVDAGKETVDLVCGGTNLREGMKVAFARVGARVRWHGEGEPVTLAPAEIRGARSFGMICGASEIGLADLFPHADREILDLSWLGASDGTPLSEALGVEDPVFETEVTTNRPDALAMVGLAREASAILKAPFLWKEPALPSAPKKAGVPLAVTVTDKALCPRYEAAVLEGVRVAESPAWLRIRLQRAGIRPISNIVDITNYVMLETGQPMHAFDYDALRGGAIEVRKARSGEKILALDGKEYALAPDMLVIADGERPTAIAGVMGGDATGVSAKTTRIVFEAAAFDPVSVRRTSRALTVQTDSSSRFEKGLSVQNTAPALARAVQLAAELAGARLAGPVTDRRAKPYAAKSFAFDHKAISSQIGVVVPEKEQKRILEALGFSMKKKGKGMLATVPWWRDHDIEDGRDLTEEVARIVGYHTLPGALPATAPPLLPPVTEHVVEDRLKTLLADLGGTEIMTYSFVSEELLAAEKVTGPAVRIANPLSVDYVAMRRSLVPSMLAAVAANQEERPDGMFFEIARTYLPKTGDLPDEPLMACVACYGKAEDGAQFTRLKGMLERIAAEWNLELATRAPHANPQPPTPDVWHPGRTVELLFAGRPAGMLGETHPSLAASLGVERRVAVLVFPVLALASAAKPRSYKGIPAFPPVKRDISFVVSATTIYDEVADLLADSGGLLLSYDLFDTYQGKGVPEGKKSMAFHLTFGASDRTLAADEADAAFARIAELLAKKLGAEVRA